MYEYNQAKFEDEYKDQPIKIKHKTRGPLCRIDERDKGIIVSINIKKMISQEQEDLIRDFINRTLE
ncbi:MAG: hypothetical protein ACFFD4_07765 [Candidatus Odinarchaeota archaeon]